MTPASTSTHIRRATTSPDDITAVTSVLTEAFLHGDLADWLIPDETERLGVYIDYFRMLAEHATTHGHVEIIDDTAAAALWYDDAVDSPAGYDERLAAITGAALPRFQQVDQAMHDHHPPERPHAYLAFLAVRPHQQGHGYGAALLAHRHTDLDQKGWPAYLEATGPRNSALYERHGYQHRAPFSITPGGPQLYPMWRPSSSHTT
jgi:GNAT superfamily N-acetyltransferase